MIGCSGGRHLDETADLRPIVLDQVNTPFFEHARALQNASWDRYNSSNDL